MKIKGNRTAETFEKKFCCKLLPGRCRVLSSESHEKKIVVAFPRATPLRLITTLLHFNRLFVSLLVLGTAGDLTTACYAILLYCCRAAHHAIKSQALTRAGTSHWCHTVGAPLLPKMVALRARSVFFLRGCSPRSIKQTFIRRPYVSELWFW